MLPHELHAWVADALTRCTTADAARVVFDEARGREQQQQHQQAAKTSKDEPDGDSDRDADDEGWTGVMVGYFLPAKTAERLALPNQGDEGVQTPEDLHVTMLYLGDTRDFTRKQLGKLLDEVGNFCQDEPPLVGRTSGVGRFAGKEGSDVDPVYASVDVKGLHQFRERLAAWIRKRAGLDWRDDFAYTPHITLAYVPSDAPMPVTNVPTLPLTIDRVTVAFGNERHAVPLGEEQGYVVEDLKRYAAAIALDEVRALRAEVLAQL